MPRTKKSPPRDWRTAMLSRIRALIKEADPNAKEAVKFKTPSNPAGVPVWYHDGMICTGETYQKHLRISFTKGPLLKDPKKLLNSYRAIIIHEGDTLNASAFKALFREAVILATTGKRASSKQKKSRAAKAAR